MSFALTGQGRGWIRLASVTLFSAVSGVSLIWVALSALSVVQSATAAAALLPPPASSSPVLSPACLARLAPANLAIAGVSGEAAGGLLASIGLSTSDASALLPAREEHSIALAADAEVCAAIRAGGLNPERAAALHGLQTRLNPARVVLEAAEEDLWRIAFAALIDRVGTDNATLAQRAASNLSGRVPDAWNVLDLPPDSPVWRTLESASLKAKCGLPNRAFAFRDSFEV